MYTNEMLDEMLDQAVKRIQHSIQHFENKNFFISIKLQIANVWWSNMGGQTHPALHPAPLVFSMLDEMLDALRWK